MEERQYLDEKTGYLYVILQNDEGEWTKAYVHELVAKVFVPNPRNYKYVKHINGIKTDNRAKNLKWVKNKPF